MAGGRGLIGRKWSVRESRGPCRAGLSAARSPPGAEARVGSVPGDHRPRQQEIHAELEGVHSQAIAEAVDVAGNQEAMGAGAEIDVKVLRLDAQARRDQRLPAAAGGVAVLGAAGNMEKQRR